jgi:hypothetical protein
LKRPYSICVSENFRGVFIAVSFLLLSAFFISSCSSKKGAVEKEEPTRHRTSGYLLKRYENNKFKFDWIGMKLDAEFITMGNTQGFKATVRMRRDSAIWISISPALGIEVFRILVTPDSLWYISKIPDNKYYYKGNFQVISDVVGTDLDFNMLQDLLIGNAIGLEEDEGRFRSEIDNNLHLLISKYKRKIRRVVGVDDRKLEGDTIVVNPNDPRYKRTVERADDDLIISRYWLEPQNFRLVQSIFNDLIKQRTMEVHYSDFHQSGEQFYPSKCQMKTTRFDNRQELTFEINKLVTDKTFDFPFEIPDGFQRRDSI